MTTRLLKILMPARFAVVTVSKVIVPADAVNVPSPPRLPLSVKVLFVAPIFTVVPDWIVMFHGRFDDVVHENVLLPPPSKSRVQVLDNALLEELQLKLPADFVKFPPTCKVTLLARLTVPPVALTVKLFRSYNPEPDKVRLEPPDKIIVPVFPFMVPLFETAPVSVSVFAPIESIPPELIVKPAMVTSLLNNGALAALAITTVSDDNGIPPPHPDQFKALDQSVLIAPVQVQAAAKALSTEDVSNANDRIISAAIALYPKLGNIVFRPMRFLLFKNPRNEANRTSQLLMNDRVIQVTSSNGCLLQNLLAF